MPDDIKAPEKPAGPPPAPAIPGKPVDGVSPPASPRPMPAPTEPPKDDKPKEPPKADLNDDPAAGLDDKPHKPVDKPKEPAEPAPAPAPSKPAKQHTPGTGMAIVAAVVIVIALGAMFTYAYIKTQN